jgi:hypothetical protein
MRRPQLHACLATTSIGFASKLRRMGAHFIVGGALVGVDTIALAHCVTTARWERLGNLNRRASDLRLPSGKPLE